LLAMLMLASSHTGYGQEIGRKQIDSVCAIGFDKTVADPGRMAEVFRQHYDAAAALGYKQGMAALLSRLSLASYYLGKYDRSTSYSLQAIDIFEELGDSTSLGTEYCGLGYRMKRRDLDKAFGYMRPGIAILARAPNRRPYGEQVNNFGVLFEMRGDIDSAIYFYNLSASIKKELGDSMGMAYSYNNIFQALLISSRHDSALHYLDRSTAIRKKLGDELGITENYTLYGDYYFNQGNYPAAIESFEAALQRSRAHGYIYLIQYTASYIAQCYEKMGKKAEALDYYKIYTQFKDSLTNTETNKAIAELEIKFETEKKEKELTQHKAELAQTELEVKQRNYLLGGLGLVLLFIIIISYYIYRQQKFKQERLIRENQLKDEISRITLANKLQDERLRISRDLHDNIGSQLTFIISSLDNLSVMLKNADERTTGRIKKINEFTRDTITQLRDTIWAMNREQITFQDLRERLVNYIARAEAAQQSVSLELDADIQENTVFSSMQGMNVFRVIQEATNNAIKYARPSVISVSMQCAGGSLSVNISDNGEGFDPAVTAAGNGLMNMKRRIEDVSGRLEIDSIPGKGTMVRFTVPLNN
jgi:signal transduction histidine kinase